MMTIPEVKRDRFKSIRLTIAEVTPSDVVHGKSRFMAIGTSKSMLASRTLTVTVY